MISLFIFKKNHKTAVCTLQIAKILSTFVVFFFIVDLLIWLFVDLTSKQINK